MELFLLMIRFAYLAEFLALFIRAHVGGSGSWVFKLEIVFQRNGLLRYGGFGATDLAGKVHLVLLGEEIIGRLDSDFFGLCAVAIPDPIEKPKDAHNGPFPADSIVCFVRLVEAQMLVDLREVWLNEGN